jgi:hypothetical protein
MQQNYDKFSYSHQRNRSEKEENSYKSPRSTSTPNKKSSATTTTKNQNQNQQQQQQQVFAKQHDASISVLNPLKHGAYSFAIAEDGILHSRIVSPPRICYAPVISELDAPNMPDTPWERLKKLMNLTPAENNKNNNSNNNQNKEIDFVQLGAYDWYQVVAAINHLEQQDKQREEALIATLENNNNNGEGDDQSAMTMTRRIALYKDRKSIFESEKITAVDRAKIELIWKRARMMLVDNLNKQQMQQQNNNNNKNEKPLESSAKYEDIGVAVPPAAKRASSPTANHHNTAGSSRASSPAISSRASSAARQNNNNQKLSRENSFNNPSSDNSANPYGGRGTIFNEKLKWTDKPRVDSNNKNHNNVVVGASSARSRRF